MDGHRFDEIARLVAFGTSRRGVLKGIAASLAAITAPIGMRVASAGACQVLYDLCETAGGQTCCDGLVCNQENFCEFEQPTPTDTAEPTEFQTETATDLPTETATLEPTATETVSETEDPATEVPASSTPTIVPETQSPATEVPAATSVPVGELPNTGNGEIEGSRNWWIPAGLLGAGAALAARFGLRNVVAPSSVEVSDDK